jgi:hypothetical protein
MGITSSGAGTTAKCRCETLNIVGLTVCAGDQLQCRGDDSNVNSAPCQPTFSSRVIITASAISTQFPPSNILYGNLFFDFQTTTIRYAIQYYAPATAVAQFNSTSPTVVREDILFPCKTVDRKIFSSSFLFSSSSFKGTSCTSSSGIPVCSASFNSNQIPRLFHEGAYSINALTSALLPDSSDCSAAPSLASSLGLNPAVQCFKKTVRSTDLPSTIAYIWACNQLACGAATAGIYEVQVAVSVDGTVWELWRNSSGPSVRGAVIATPVSPCVSSSTFSCPAWNPPAGYNFTKFDGGACSSLTCPNQVDVAFAVDEQTGISNTDYFSYVLVCFFFFFFFFVSLLCLFFSFFFFLLFFFFLFSLFFFLSFRNSLI